MLSQLTCCCLGATLIPPGAKFEVIALYFETSPAGKLNLSKTISFQSCQEEPRVVEVKLFCKLGFSVVT